MNKYLLFFYFCANSCMQYSSDSSLSSASEQRAIEQRNAAAIARAREEAAQNEAVEINTRVCDLRALVEECKQGAAEIEEEIIELKREALGYIGLLGSASFLNQITEKIWKLSQEQDLIRQMREGAEKKMLEEMAEEQAALTRFTDQTVLAHFHEVMAKLR
jgi:hypothetical protein